MRTFILAILGLAILVGPALAQKPAPESFILDTDIGDDIDDAYALALIATRPGIRLLGVTTTFGETRERAELAAKLLSVMGRRDVPVFAGRRGTSSIGKQYEWAKGFRSPQLRSEPAIEFMRREIERAPEQVTLIGIGPMVNLGDLVTTYPEVRSKIKRIVLMAGSVYVGYNNRPPPNPEWNVRADPKAARAVFASGVPITMAGLEVTTMMQLTADYRRRIFGYGTPLTDALAALTDLWAYRDPTLFDPVAVAWALGYRGCAIEERHVVVDDSGMTRIESGTPNVTILVQPHPDDFLEWYVRSLAPRPPSPHARTSPGKGENTY